MSSNQKQAPSGAPQQQRYAQGADGYHVATTPTAFVQQTTNQQTNQGPTIRGMAQTGPPNQSSTPPQNDINKMQAAQQGQLPIAFMPQPSVRASQQNFYRTPAPNQGGPRMTNHHRQTMSSTATPNPAMFSQHMAIYPTGHMTTPMPPFPLPIQYNAQRAPFFSPQPYTTVLSNQYIQSTFPPQQSHAQHFIFSNTTPMPMPTRQGPPPQVAAAAPTGAQPTQQTMPMQPPMQPHNKKKPRSNAVPIINPKSGKDIFDEDDVALPSGESSARETPQPSTASIQQLISADFAKRVAIRASEDKDSIETESIHSIPVQPITFHSSLPPQHHNTTSHIHTALPIKENDAHHKIDSSLAQNSKLQASTKEFIPEITKHAPKENITPVVSANTEGVEVMLPPKPRDRESPVKIRRQQQRDSIPKETPSTTVTESTPTHIQEQIINATTANIPLQPSVEQDYKTSKSVSPGVAKVKGPSDLSRGDHRTLPSQINSEDSINAKNKSNIQKSKENIASNQTQVKPVMPVPGSQPPKQSSKTNKMRELNIRGASKEGTDMDAFNTNDVPTMDNCNNDALKEEIIENVAVVTQQTLQLSQQQSQSQPQAQQQQQQPQEQQSIQKLSDVKTISKPKVDVTSIVKEIPRNVKPILPQQLQQPSTDSQDETDRVACEKLVQVKNEANINKTNSSENNDTQMIDKTVIRYKKDQWSPLNTDGKKCYDPDFLLTLQNNPNCRKKPDNLPDLEIVLKDSNTRTRIDLRSFSINRPTEVFMPAFHKSASQRGPLPPNRKSQQGKTGMKGGKNMIHVTLSLSQDVKLRETENAWRPARLSNNVNLTEDELKTAELYKKVRGVLNKLTPEKFDKLLSQVRTLHVDNEERLQGVIDLIFEKAVDEPNFSVAYALMCKELATIQVPTKESTESDPQYVNFRKLIITRCQLEFEKNSLDENARNLKLKEIEECTDPEKKKELQLLLEEEDRRMRIKSVGNIRFIGELFKKGMLTVKIMIRCINILLVNKDEDSLECLCKLLTTIGNDLEEKKENLQTYFNVMQEIVDKKHNKISSRVRFMLQDVIDLRNSKWIPRRQDLNPKTMDQIQKEADTEQMNIQVMNSGPINTPRKDDRLGGNTGNPGGSDRKRRNNLTDDGGWSMVPSRNRTAYTVESSKLMNKPPPVEEMTLGSQNLFGLWGRGSNINKMQQSHAPPVTNMTNMYASLENTSDSDKNRSYESRLNKEPYMSKGHSMERAGYRKNYEDGRSSRSGSQQRSASTQQQKTVSTPIPTPTPVSIPTPIPKQLTPEQISVRLQNIVEEYLTDSLSLDECISDIKIYLDSKKIDEFATELYEKVLERSLSARQRVSKLMAHLVQSQLCSSEVLYKALKELLSQADDLVIDIPMLWNYLAEMIAPLIIENVLTFNTLREIVVAQGHADKLLAPLLKTLIVEKGPNYVKEKWQTSDIKFSDFMASMLVDNFVKDNKFDFLIGGAGTPIGQRSCSWDQVHNKLIEFFKTNTSIDNINNWIATNIGEKTIENQFFRTLISAVVENAVYTVNNGMKLKPELLKLYYPLLQRYVDNKERHELQCIFALQALVHKWEHPPGLLLSIFEPLWEDGILSHDSFLAWEVCSDPAEQEGKGVALKSVQSLFTSLKEVDDESGSSASEDA